MSTHKNLLFCTYVVTSYLFALAQLKLTQAKSTYFGKKSRAYHITQRQDYSSITEWAKTVLSWILALGLCVCLPHPILSCREQPTSDNLNQIKEEITCNSSQILHFATPATNSLQPPFLLCSHFLTPVLSPKLGKRLLARLSAVSTSGRVSDGPESKGHNSI